MKDVMAKESSAVHQGVPTFEYSPASERQPLLFELFKPLDDLEDMLMLAFAGQTVRMERVYDTHNYGRRYVESNYKDALTSLETKGKIRGNPSFEKRPMRLGKRTCAPATTFTFPG